MPPGHNGPWGDRETPLRNTGNWLQQFLSVYERTGSPRLKRAAERAATFLLDSAHRPGDGAFLHLPDRARQEGNGLIGQAWTVLALFSGYRILEWEELRTAAQTVLRRHAFDHRLGLWSNLGLAGQSLGVNSTLNQQIWFAAAARFDPQPDEQSRGRIRRFLESLHSHVRLSRSGCIEHRIHPRSLWRRFPVGWRTYLRPHRARGSVAVERAVGYHAFALYGLALLFGGNHNAPACDSRFVAAATAFGDSTDHRVSLRTNRFAYGYNPTGIEMAFAILSFSPGSITSGQAWLGAQFRRCFDPNTGLMERNSPDPATLAGRMCEANRLPDWTVDLS